MYLKAALDRPAPNRTLEKATHSTTAVGTYLLHIAEGLGGFLLAITGQYVGKFARVRTPPQEGSLVVGAVLRSRRTRENHQTNENGYQCAHFDCVLELWRYSKVGTLLEHACLDAVGFVESTPLQTENKFQCTNQCWE